MPLSSYSETVETLPRKSPGDRPLQPDESSICVLVVLFLMLYNKPCLPYHTRGDGTEEPLLPGVTMVSKSNPRHLRSSNHSIARQDLRRKVLARQQFAKKQRDAEQQESISPIEKPADIAPFWTKLRGLKNKNGFRLKRACQVLHCGSRHLSRILLSTDLSLQELGTDPNTRSQITLKAPAAFAEQNDSLGSLALRWLAGKFSKESTERTTMEFWRLAALVAQHCAASKA